MVHPAGFKDVIRSGWCLQVVNVTANKTKLDEFSMVFLNNLLSLPLIFGLMVFYGELPGVMRDPALKVIFLSTYSSF